MDLRVYAIRTPGSHVFRIRNLEGEKASDDQHRMIFKRPHLGRTVLYLLGIVLGAGRRTPGASRPRSNSSSQGGKLLFLLFDGLLQRLDGLQLRRTNGMGGKRQLPVPQFFLEILDLPLKLSLQVRH